MLWLFRLNYESSHRNFSFSSNPLKEHYNNLNKKQYEMSVSKSGGDSHPHPPPTTRSESAYAHLPR